MLSAPLRIIIVAALCVVGLIGLVISEGMAREGGQELVLPMEAVDPRSLLSGHYVLVNVQERSMIPNRCDTFGISTPRTWISLVRRQALTDRAHQDSSTHTAIGTFSNRQDAEVAGDVAVRGHATCVDLVMEGDVIVQPGWVTLDLGVDRFHIGQAEAMRIERVLREQNVDEATRAYAILSIGRDGRARLKGLLLDGERLDLSWL